MKLNGLPNKSAVRLVDLRLYLNEMIDNSSYSQRELAIMANVSQSSIALYVNGEVDSPSLEWIVRVFKALDVPTTVLLDFIY
jgi:transcriptional regulator with XRE-family HTH domain